MCMLSPRVCCWVISEGHSVAAEWPSLIFSIFHTVNHMNVILGKTRYKVVLPAWLQYILQPCECRTMWEDNDTDALRRLRIFTNMSGAPPYIRTFTLHQRHQTCAFKSFHYCVNI